MKSPYVSPIGEENFSSIALLSILLGLVLTATYFVMQMQNVANTQAKDTGGVASELVLGFASSVFLGIGCLFLCLQFGLWI
jgi:hypothetical protein